MVVVKMSSAHVHPGLSGSAVQQLMLVPARARASTLLSA
jgi:hypothetical protein